RARIDIDAVFDRRHGRSHRARPELQPIGAARDQALLLHPDERCGELIGEFGARLRRCEQVAARDVDLVFQRQGHRVAGGGDWRPEPMTTTGSPGMTEPAATVPANPRKSRSGRLIHCTGKRNGRAAAVSSTSTLSRYSRRFGPSCQGMFGEGAVMLSPCRAEIGIIARDAKPSPAATPA